MKKFWRTLLDIFNNYHVALSPGVTRKQLATRLGALNDRLRPLYGALDIPCGCANRFCIGDASLKWGGVGGGRPGDPDYVFPGQDFRSWAPNHFDGYACPSDLAVESKLRPPSRIGTWRINSQHMIKLFSSVYGSGHLPDRLLEIEDRWAHHIREPRKYTLPFIRNDWVDLNHRRIQEHREITNVLRFYAKAEGPTYDQLKSIGMTIGPSDGNTIYSKPCTFNLSDPSGYFQMEIIRNMNDGKELADWHHYHNTSTRNTGTRTGAVGDPATLPSPPLAPVERRFAGSPSPQNTKGKKLCWNFNTHAGCRL